MDKLQAELKDGTIVIGDYFSDSDYEKIKEIFQKWLDINGNLKSLGGRALNVPDIVSEAIYCYFFDAVRTNNTARSYDAVNIKNHAGVQIKSTSIKNDLTSFGPKSTWDELFFIDFAPNGKIDGRVDIYKIKDNFKSLIMNGKKGETFTDQQKQGRRPRFSIKKEIIAKQNLKPIKSIDLTV